MYRLPKACSTIGPRVIKFGVTKFKGTSMQAALIKKNLDIRRYATKSDADKKLNLFEELTSPQLLFGRFKSRNRGLKPITEFEEVNLDDHLVDNFCQVKKITYEELKGRYNKLEGRYNQLVVIYNALAVQHDDIKDKFTRNKEKLNTAQLFAAKFEFLLLYRNKIVGIEERYVKGMPSRDSDYLNHFTSKSEFHGISNETILGKKHFRAWLWLLVEGDENIFRQLKTLRKSLKYDVTKYIWFADKMQGTFQLLSDDNHAEGRELYVKFVVPTEVKNYIKILSPDLREAANVFFISEGWITET